MNFTYVYNTYKQPPVVFADFDNELIAIIIMCTLILTRGIVSTLFKWFKGEESHHHVHYSTEFATSDLNLNLNQRKPLRVEIPVTPPNTPVYKKKKPKEPPRDELV